MTQKLAGAVHQFIGEEVNSLTICRLHTQLDPSASKQISVTELLGVSLLVVMYIIILSAIRQCIAVTFGYLLWIIAPPTVGVGKQSHQLRGKGV